MQDASNNEPLGFASVVLFQASDSSLVTGTISNADGSFQIDVEKGGSYYLEAQFLGYSKRRISNINLSKGQKENIGIIGLQPDERMLAEIEVTGEKMTTMSKIDRQVYDVGNFQSGQGGTAVDMLRNLPSITVTANGEIAARGSTGFVVMLNGKPVQSDAIAILNQLPANAIQNIEVITAPSAKYDPEGKAGIINIVTTKGSTDGLFAVINTKIGLPSVQDYDNADYAQRYGADFTINYRKEDWDFSFGASYLRNDIAGRREGDVYTILNDTLTRFPSDGERSTDEVNLSGRFTIAYTPNTSNTFSLGFYAGERTNDRTADILYFDNSKSVGGVRQSTYQYYNENLRTRTGDFVLGSFDYSHAFKDKSRISTSLLYEYTLLGGPTTNRNLGWPETKEILQDEYNTNQNPLHGIRYQLDFQSKPLPWGQFEAGLQFRDLDHVGDFIYERRNNNTGVFELVPEFSSEVDLSRRIYSGYTQMSGEVNKWIYGAGLRMEYMDRNLSLKDKNGTLDTTYHYDFIKPFPSANIQYSVSDDFRLKFAYGRRIERTTTFKMNPFPEREHSETLEQGDPQLRPEFIDLFEFGASKEVGDNSIYATAYFRRVANVVNRVNTIYNDSILNRIYSNVGIGKSFGLELGSELKLASWWTAFAGGNIYNYQIVGSFDNKPIDSQSWIYSVNANTTFKLAKDWSIQWSLNYLSARNTAQGSDSNFYNPSLTLRKSFLDNRLSTTLQWLNMDMGLLRSNEQRITTFRPGEFYTTTNYVYEVDVLTINISYSLNSSKNKAKFIKSEFGENEF